MPRIVAVAKRLADEYLQQFHPRGDCSPQFASAVDEDSPLLLPMPPIAQPHGVLHSRILQTGNQWHGKEPGLVDSELNA